MMPQTAMPPRIAEALPDDDMDGGRIRLHMPSARSTNVVEPPTPAAGGIKPLAYLKYRWVMVVFLGGFLGCVLALTAWKVIPSKFTATTMVRIYSDIPYVNGPESAQVRNDFTTYFTTQKALIKSPLVLNAALRNPEVATLPMLHDQVDPIHFLEEELKIEQPENSEVIKISLSGEDPRACAMIVNAVKDGYFSEVQQQETNRKNERLSQLRDSISKMQEDLDNKYHNLAAVPQSAENDATAMMALNSAIAQMAKFEETRANIETQLQSLRRHQESIEQKLKNPGNEVPEPSAAFLQSIDNDPSIQTLRKKIELSTRTADELVKMCGDPMHPQVVLQHKKISDAKEQIERLRKQRLDEYHNSELPNAVQRLKANLEQCKADIAHFTLQKKQQDEAIVKYEKNISKNGLPGFKKPNFNAVEYRERMNIIQGMVAKASQLQIEIKAPPRVQKLEPAAVPTKKDTKKQLMGTVFAGLVGFGLVGLGVIVHESRIRRAMSLSDIQQGMLLPIVGVLPARQEGANVLASDEACGEAIEKTRTNLLQQFTRSGGKVIALASALTEEGKGYLASRLGESFARAGGRTLLLDFDLRTPSLHEHVHGNRERGFCEVMLAQVEFQEAVQVLPNGMMFLPAGAWRNEMRLALTSERIEAFLEWLRQQFDFVVVNTHPLLSVAETILVCRHADGVVLSVERLESRMPMVARAHEKLAVLAPEAFGVVFQGASAEECFQ